MKYLIEQCKSENPDFQVNAIEELSDNKVHEALPTLLELAGSDDAYVRIAVAEGLGYLGVRDIDATGPVLVRLLDDPDSFVRDDAVGSLGLLAYIPARAALENVLLNDPEWVVRASAAEALGHLGDEHSLGPLKTSLVQDEIEVVRGWAAHALGLLGNADVLPLLESRLDAENEDNTKVDILAARYRLGSQTDLKRLLDIATSEDNAVIYGMVNRLENLLKLKNPPTLTRDADDILLVLKDVAKRFPMLRDQIDDMASKLSEIKARLD